MKIHLYLLSLLFAPLAFAEPTSVTSPNGKLGLMLSVSDTGGLRYQLALDAEPITGLSGLGMISNGSDIAAAPQLEALKKTSARETFPQLGFRSLGHNDYNGVVISTGPDRAMEFRVFDLGIAYRYLDSSAGAKDITADKSSLNVPPQSKVWYQTNLANYEGMHITSLLAEVPEKAVVAGAPVVFQLPGSGVFLAVTEAGLTDFTGMRLKLERSGLASAILVENSVKQDGPFSSPWRVILVARDLNGLYQSDIVAAVSPPPDPALFPQDCNTPWIRPGRSVWSWLGGGGVSAKNMNEYAYYAGQLGFEYNLIDEGWGSWNGGGEASWQALKEVVDYSTTQGVKTWIWKAYPDRNKIDGLQTSERRQAFFKRCKELGVVGVKIDFFDKESKEIIEFYQAALKEAAGLQIMVDFHGANKPTGESRTYPNEMSREGIRGLENKGPWAWHDTVLPFTRMLAGHADFTPGHFGGRRAETTWGHQLASAVIYTSPFLCWADHPKNLLGNPAVDLIKAIPSAWDESLVLAPSEIGRLAVLVRKKGDDWFLAAMNGEGMQKFSIPLSFLGSGSYQADFVLDGEKPDSVTLKKSTLSSADKLDFDLAPAGGFVVRFTKK